MSLSTVNDVIRTRDPRVDLMRGNVMCIEEGARNVKLYNRTASSANTTGLQFDNIDPGSTGYVVDRKIYVKTSFGLKMEPLMDNNQRISLRTGTAADPSDLTAGAAAADLNKAISVLGFDFAFGPRAFPLSQACQSIQLDINGEAFTYKLGEYVEPLMRYDNNMNFDKIDYSMTPSMQDTNKKYNDPFATEVSVSATIANAKIANNLNPLGNYGQNVNRSARNSYLPNIPTIENTDIKLAKDSAGADIKTGNLIQNFTKNGWTFTFAAGRAAANPATIGTTLLQSIEYTGNKGAALTVTEPVLIPVCLFGKMDERGFYGINEMKLSLNFYPDLVTRIYAGQPLYSSPVEGDDARRIKTYGLSLGAYGVSGSADSNTHIYYNVLTPKFTPELPPSNIYTDQRIELTRYKYTGSTNVINNTSVGTIPKRIYVWAGIDQSRKTEFDVDCYLNIKSIQFDFNSQNTQFSGVDPEQLYLQCRRAGLQMDFLQFSQFIGAVYCIDFTTDVSLDSGDYPGRIGNYNFTINVEFDKSNYLKYSPAAGAKTNVARPDDEIFIYVAVIRDGYVAIQNQVCARTTGLVQVNPNEIPLSIKSYDTKWENLYGGAFIDELKKMGKKVGKAAMAVGPAAIALGTKYGPKLVDKYGPKVMELVETYGPEVMESLGAMMGAGISPQEAMRLVSTYGLNPPMRGKKKTKGGAMAGKSHMKKQLSLY